MGIEYATLDGIVIDVGRVDQHAIDKVAISVPLPQPPVRKVAAWGDIEEELPVLDDPQYMAQMMIYRARLAKTYSAIIAPAIRPLSEFSVRVVDDLENLGLKIPDSRIERLLFSLPDRDVDAITALVLYQSTVTERGIAEAQAVYNVTWMERPISAWRVPSSPATYSAVFEARKAALAYHYNWTDFCTLSGQEQSAVVCHWRLSNKLEWLEVERERSRPKKKR